jgi:putative intracellular protease/amidase
MRNRHLAIASLVASTAIFSPLDSAACSVANEHGRTRTVGVLVFPGVELLDFTGPVEVFTEANGFEKAFHVVTIGGSLDPIRSKNAVTIVPDFAVANAPALDILVMPGGEVRAMLGDAPLSRFIASTVPTCEIAFSVCNGVFALSRHGFLDGLEATTHWTAISWLRQAAPQTIVHADRRFVDNGHVVTAAGISAGIDGALHLVDRLLGRASARRTARRMEYEWRPTTPDPSEIAPIAKARDVWYANDWKSTVTEYRTLSEADPGDAIARVRLGVGVLLERPADPSALRALAYVHSTAKRPANAIPLLERAFAVESDSWEVRLFLGRAQFEAGEYANCVSNLGAVWSAGAGSEDDLLRIAKARALLGDDEGALAAIEEGAYQARETFLAALGDAAFARLIDSARFQRAAEVMRATKP